MTVLSITEENRRRGNFNDRNCLECGNAYDECACNRCRECGEAVEDCGCRGTTFVNEHEDVSGFDNVDRLDQVGQ